MCDWPDCKERAVAPAGLNLTEPLSIRPRAVAAAGWLFVTTDRTYRHFCPRCKDLYLDRLSEE